MRGDTQRLLSLYCIKEVPRGGNADQIEFTTWTIAGTDVASKQRSERFAAKPSQVAEELLEPILSFLQQAGISEIEATKAFKSAWRRSVTKKKTPVQLDSLEDTQPFVDLVTLWSRNASYLDKQGLPRDLQMRGRNSFASLVRMISPRLDPKNALFVLQAYGNVERLDSGKVRLTKPFFHIKSNTKLAFEPSVRFLLDAARNVKSSLRNPIFKAGKGLHNRGFWRTVDTQALPKSRRREFLDFVRSMSLTFLQDVDDWLAENSVPRKGKSDVSRVGLGLFTIGAAPE